MIIRFDPINYQNEAIILSDLTVSCSTGMNHLIGANGIGKSTIMKHLVDECIRKHISFAFVDQNYRAQWLWWKTIEDNLDLAVDNTKYASYKDHPVYLQEKEWVDNLINKPFEQVIVSEDKTANLYQVSGGQLQRLIVLRSLLKSPSVLFLDEVFSALDVGVQESVVRLIQSFIDTHEGIVLSISHDPLILKALPGKVLECTKHASKEVTLAELNV